MGYATNASKLQGVGDPGIFSSIGGFLGSTIKKVATVAFQTSPAGRIFKAAQGIIQPQSVPPPFTMPGGGQATTFFQQQAQQASKGSSGSGGMSTSLVVQGKKRRRMNVLNVKALRRSTRRLAGFQREAKKVEKELRKLAPPARRRSSSAHIHHGHKH